MRLSFLKKCHNVRLLLAALCGLALTSHLDAVKTADELARFEKQVQREMTHPTAHLKKVIATYKTLRHEPLQAGRTADAERMRQMIDNMRTAIRAAKAHGPEHLKRSLRGMNPFTGKQVTIHITPPAITPRRARADLLSQHHALQGRYNQLQAEHRNLQQRHRALNHEIESLASSIDSDAPPSSPSSPRPHSPHAGAHLHTRIPTPPPTPARHQHTPAASHEDLMQQIRDSHGTPRRRNRSPEPVAPEPAHEPDPTNVAAIMANSPRVNAMLNQTRDSDTDDDPTSSSDDDWDADSEESDDD